MQLLPVLFAVMHACNKAMLMQAAQLCKSSFVTATEVEGSQPAAYSADKDHYCTVFAGTRIAEVSLPMLAV